MRISLDWLGDYAEWIETDPAKIAETITVRTAEVEKVEKQGAFLENVVVGEILSMGKHPKADRLSLAEVLTDRGPKKVVCGGTNLKVGQQVAFAHVGATVKWHGGETVTLEKTKIRGEESEGMVCAAEELELGAAFAPKAEDGERPIVDLSGRGLKTGQNLRDALGLTDTVLLFSNTAITQRPDLFSHVGFARECVAIGLARWKKKPDAALPAFPATPLPFTQRREAGDAVPRYLACLLEIGSLGETPAWMRKRLEATGWRCVSLPVDITNYVSMETGMPLHSFDAADFQGDVAIRLSKQGEKLTTLDKVERTLPEGAVVLSDDAGVFDLLGIMGGLRSSTKDTTRKVFLHSAIVDPVRIRRAIQATGHRTDASTTYEKGVPRVTARLGFALALKLFLELVPGARIVSALEEAGDEGTAPAIPFSPSRVRGLLGTDVTEDGMAKILEDLECAITRNGDAWTVTPPLHRLRDLQGPHDLAEEVARVHGADRIPSTMPMAEMRLPQRDAALHALRDGLREDGYDEIVPLSLLGPDLLRKAGLDPAACVAISNPLGETLSLLQPSAVPALLEHAERNLPRLEGELRAFHWGHVFLKGSETEEVTMALLLAPKHDGGLTEEPLLRLRRTLATLFGRIDLTMETKPLEHAPAWAHPGRSAVVSAAGSTVGLLCEAHPHVAARFGLPARAAVAEISLSRLLSLPMPDRRAQALPQFPDVVYDETVPRNHAQRTGELLLRLRGSNPLLASVHVQDLYGKKGEDSYNLTLRFTYRAPDRTLTEEEAKKAHGEVMTLLP